MFEAIILGIIQGLTEFIPVSSSAHLILFPWFFNWQGIVDSLSFDIALHTGTLLALLLYFRHEWITLLRSLTEKEGMVWKLIAGTIPAAVAGALIHDWIEQNRSPLIIIFALCIVSILMLLTENDYTESDRAGLEKVSMMTAVYIGIAQAFALVPGVSRSGITIVAGLSKGMKRADAARFSFLLGTPAVAGASLLEAKNLIGSTNFDIDIFLMGIIVSAATGYFVIKYLLIFLQNHSLRAFAYYRFFLAFVIIVSLWTNH